MFAAYKRRLTSPDLNIAKEASIRFQCWEEVTSRMQTVKPGELKYSDAIKAIPGSLLELHYFGNHCFLAKNHILKNIDRIKDIPTTIVQGRFDATCPLFMANALVDSWKKAQKDPTKCPEFHIKTAGHYATDPEIAKGLVEATNAFARRSKKAGVSR